MMSKQQELELADKYFEEALLLLKQAKYEACTNILKQANVIYEKWSMWKKWVKVNNMIGQNLNYSGNHDKAIIYLQKVLKVGEKNLNKTDEGIANSLNNIGISHYYNGNFDSAAHYFEKALIIYIIKFGKEHPKVAKGLNNMGICYKPKGDYDLAISYHQKALYIRKKHYGEEHQLVGMSLNNIGNCHSDKGNHEIALKYHKEVFAIWEKTLGTEHPKTAGSLGNIGDCYRHLGAYSLAITYFQKAIEIFKKTLSPENHFIAQDLNTIGTCYKNMGKYDLAISYHEKALLLRKKNFGNHHPRVADSLNCLGKCYFEKKAFNTAIEQFQEAFRAIAPTFQNTSIYDSPIVSDKHGYIFLEALQHKALTFLKYYDYKTQVIKDLQAAFSTIHLATKLITNIRQSYKTQGSKHTLAEKAAKTYNQAIPIALKTAEVYQGFTSTSIPQHDEFANIPYTTQGCKTLAFNFSEQSKAILLLSSLKDSEAKASANISADLLEKEKQLKIELNYLDKSIATQEAKGEKKDEELLSKFQSQYFDYKQEYDQLIEQFEADYPEYYCLKYAVETASVEAVQRYLSKTNPPVTNHQSTNQLISYHITPETIYIFTITSNRYQIHEVAKPSNFAELLEDFQDAITLARIKNYIQCASSLFDLLLLPALESVGSNTSKLIIIPHHELTTLTFDALIDTRKLTKEKREEITSSRDFSSLPYLVKDYDISYHYSATMLLHSVARQEQKRPKAASFVGFAPVSFDGSENVELALVSKKGQTRVMRSNRAGEKALDDLPSTENEVKEVFQLFEDQQLEAKAFLYASANKENLFENAVNHKYVLIATHGYAQDGDVGLSGIYLASPQKSEERSQRSDIEESDTSKVSDSSTSRENINTQTQLSTQTPEHTNTQTHKNVNTNYLLHTSEAYHLQLNADLVVLSSCSSGVGKLIAGEGMMAINRGFLYAGASNIIFTQFEIPDQSSGELVKVLFEQVLKGEGYASALRKAKLEVIRQDLKTPEDWAGFALIGG